MQRRDAGNSVDRSAPFGDECYRLASEVAAIWDEIPTVAEGRPNYIVEVKQDGVLVHTTKSLASGDGPQLVPAWMIEVAWIHLRRVGTLTQGYLLSSDGLGVKRSAFVIALLSRFPGVRVTSRSPTELGFSVAVATG